MSLRVPERRSGFDQRRPVGGPLRRGYHRVLDTYRHRPRALLAVLVVFVALNTADLVLTVRAIGLGAEEANPVMAWLLGVDPVVAAAYKLGIGAAAALVMFAMRRYRRILEASVALTGCFSALFGYHVIGVVLLPH